MFGSARRYIVVFCHVRGNPRLRIRIRTPCLFGAGPQPNINVVQLLAISHPVGFK
jgi:hypothetical protein